MRLFAAVQPPPNVLDHLENALAVVRAGRTDGLRWTLPRSWHITAAFFGEAPEGSLEEVAEALDGVGAAHEAFDAALRGAGLFDGRTLWVGCSGDGWGSLTAAAARVGADVLGRVEELRSRPHLTIARTAGRTGPRRGRRGGGPGPAGPGRAVPGGGGPGKGEPSGAGRVPSSAVGADPAALAHALALYAGPTWTVTDIVVYRSRLGAGPGGRPAYDVVHRSALRPVAG